MADDTHDGTAMIALVPPYETSEDLLGLADRDDADLDDQHITVIYLPDTQGFSADDLLAAVEDFAAQGMGIAGVPNGWGRFDTPDGSAQIALWDIVGWSAFREALASTLREHGIHWEDTHGSIPHQTMGYDEPDQTFINPGPISASPVLFGDIHVWHDDEHVGSVPLASPSMDVLASVMLRSADWDENKVNRGQPDNPGQFAPKPGGGSAPKSKDSKPKAKSTDEPKAKSKSTDGPKGADEPAGKDNESKPSKSTVVTRSTPESKKKIEKTVEQVLKDPASRPKPTDTGQYSKEESAQRGDVYGEYIPAGEFPEGDPRNDEEFFEQHEVVSALVDKYVADSPDWEETGIGGDTKMIHDYRHDKESGASPYSPERAAKHHEIVQGLMDDAEARSIPKEGKMVIMAGPSGAGKSTFLKQNKDKFGIEGDDIDHPDNYIVINPDNFKGSEYIDIDPERYPGLSENEFASIAHEESSDIAQTVAEIMIGAGYNVIIDITLGNAKKAEKKYLDIAGGEQYTDVQVALVDGDMPRSRANAGNRWKQPDVDRKGEGPRSRKWNGRFLSMDIVDAQTPTKEGYRSSNAEQFADLLSRRGDRISKSWIFDPFDESVVEGTDPKHEGFDGRTALLRVALRNLLVSSIEDTIKVNRKERIALTQGKQSVQKWLGDFKAKSIDQSELVEGLINGTTYEQQEECPYPKGSAEWYRWVESQPRAKGGLSDVQVAELKGEIPKGTFSEVNTAIYERSDKR